MKRPEGRILMPAKCPPDPPPHEFAWAGAWSGFPGQSKKLCGVCSRPHLFPESKSLREEALELFALRFVDGACHCMALWRCTRCVAEAALRGES